MLRKALLNIYSKEFHPVSDIEENLFNEIWKGINMATARGFRDAGHPDVGDGFADAIRHSNAVFSAFKVHRAQNDMARLLLDSDGTLKPFSQWSKEVMPIASHQCRTWLRTEYDTAVIRAHQAADWRQFMREKDVLPNLRWMPSTSVTPGEDHKIFWNVVRPVDDPFWNRHRPGDRWNCKCTLSSTTDLPTRIPEGAAPASDPQPGLKGNPAVTRSLFSDDHPYFPSDCSSCPFKGRVSDSLMRFFGARRKKDCFKCRNIDKRLKKLADPKFLAKSEYYELKHDPDYHDVRYDKKSGGVRATHVGHNDDTGRKEFFGGTMSGADLERECVEQLFTTGHKVILCDESKKLKPGEKAAALDLQLDGQMMDIRSITGKSRWYTHALLTKNSQLRRYNARPDISSPAEALCLYFHDADLFVEDHLLKSINKYKYFYGNNGEKIVPIIKNIYVVIKGRKDILKYDV